MFENFDWGGTASSLLRAIPAIKTQFEGVDLGPQQAVSSRLGQLSEAMYDPNNPIYQQLYRSVYSQNQQNLAQAIQEMQRQNRKATVTGRTPVISPERGGEAIFRALAGQQQASQDSARNEAITRLRYGSTATHAAYDPYRQNAQQDYQNRQSEATGFSDIGRLIGSLFGL